MRREDWVKFDQWESFYEVVGGYTTGRWVSRVMIHANFTVSMRGKWANKYLYRHVSEEELDHIKLSVVRTQFAEARGQAHEAR